jgi:hypothetical protein
LPEDIFCEAWRVDFTNYDGIGGSEWLDIMI